MKKILLCGAAVLTLLLSACTVRETQPYTTEGYLFPMPELPTMIEEIPDVGLFGVELIAPEGLSVTPDAPNAAFTVTVDGVCPDGAPEGGRLCTVNLKKDGELIDTKEDFPLINGAAVDFSVEIPFKRFTSPDDCELTVELVYGPESRTVTVPVTVRDYPDEYYSMTCSEPFPYALNIYTDKNVIIVYGIDDAGEYKNIVKVFICSTGISTPRSGTYHLQRKYDWKALIHGVWGQYSSWVTGDILIHSVPYYGKNKTALNSYAYNLLGKSVSAGCIRMRCCDCKWIYDYCPCGTDVTFFTGAELPDGVDYPTYEPLDLESPNAGWDPTDPDPENPWKPELPDISWSSRIPWYDELHTAYTTLDRNSYAGFVSTSDLFPEQGE